MKYTVKSSPWVWHCSAASASVSVPQIVFVSYPPLASSAAAHNVFWKSEKKSEEMKLGSENFIQKEIDFQVYTGITKGKKIKAVFKKRCFLSVVFIPALPAKEW